MIQNFGFDIPKQEASGCIYTRFTALLQAEWQYICSAVPGAGAGVEALPQLVEDAIACLSTESNKAA